MVIEISEKRFQDFFEEVWDCSLCNFEGNIVGKPCTAGDLDICKKCFCDWLKEEN